ncbi:MAG: hypothetical protein GX565_14195 [Lentisphaerae bacterium]|nr:hypothetical protein [Lentisphaerota bacterium]
MPKSPPLDMAEKSWPMSVQKRAGSLAALSAMREKSGSLGYSVVLCRNRLVQRIVPVSSRLHNGPSLLRRSRSVWYFTEQ